MVNLVFSMSIISSFKSKKKNKYGVKEQQESHGNAKICYICQQKLKNKNVKDKKYRKVTYNCHYTGEYRGTVHSISNLKYSVSKKIPITFSSGSNIILS